MILHETSLYNTNVVKNRQFEQLSQIQYSCVDLEYNNVNAIQKYLTFMVHLKAQYISLEKLVYTLYIQHRYIHIMV